MKIKANKQAQKKKPAPIEQQPVQAADQSMAVEVVPVSAPIVLPDTVEDFSIEIKRRVQNHCQQFVADTIAIGEALLEATKKYDQDLKALAAKIGLAYNTLTQYVKIANRFGTQLLSWAGAQLPASVDSLVRLSRLEEAQLEEAIKNGKVKPDMGRKDVKELLREYRPSRSKPLRKPKTCKAADVPPNATLEEVKRQLLAFQEAVENCQQQFPGSYHDLILSLEGHAGWVKSLIGTLRRSTE